MKAKDYYDRYVSLLVDPATVDTAVAALVKDFTAETKQIAESRGVKTMKSIRSITEEMNSKWNKLAEMLPVDILRRNGWRNYFNRIMEDVMKGGETA